MELRLECGDGIHVDAARRLQEERPTDLD